MPPTLPHLTIDLAAVTNNYVFLREKAVNSKTAAVVKANGYGLGMVPIAKALDAVGCKIFFTAHFSEAMQLRSSLPEASITPFHGFFENDYNEAIDHNITPMLNSLAQIEGWSGCARRREKKLPCLVHLDSGMNRLGLAKDELEKLIATPSLLDAIDVHYWVSHFACSEEFDNPMTTIQRDTFKAAVARLPKAELSLANSSGLFWGRDYLGDLVRPGIALYGANPTPKKPNPMHSVVELKAPILQIRNVDSPMTVGYGATHRVARKGRIATLALGYADGYHRALSGRGQVKIGDFLSPVVGRISMDLTTVDVSDVPESVAHPGAFATVIGPHRTVDQLAEEAGTISYEILTGLGARFQRRYIEGSGG